MDFEILGVISEVKTFAEGNGVRIRHYLNTTYAGGRKMYWRHCKGRATVQYSIVMVRFGMPKYIGLKVMAWVVAMKR